MYSYRLSVVHFWALVFLYIWVGPHHLLYTALPDWAQTLGMIFSLMLSAPSWGGVLHGLLTLRGAWHKAGRVWRGHACLQTMFLEGLYRPLQRLIEGTRERRLRCEAGHWNTDRITRRALFWSLYAALSVAVAYGFHGYLTPVRALQAMIKAGPAASPEAFVLVTVFAVATFFNFA